ncbi:MAG: RidA family protein [Rhodospirillales bacterium]|nr:RidA family protein [Rhodospirillales bacterium]
MPGRIETKLAELNIVLPTPAAPAANYVPFTISQNIVFVSGQITMWDGTLQYVGRVGDGLTTEDGYKAARICGLNLLAQLKVACGGSLDRVTRVLKLGGFVNCATDYTDLPKVINGASDLMAEVFGADIGAHARFAVGASSLPFGIATEVDGTFEIN